MIIAYRPLILALLLGPLTIHAPAVAGDCWVPTVENPTTGFGDATTAKRHAALRDRLLKAEAIERADPVINAIGEVRYRGHRYIDTPRHPGAPKAGNASVWLHQKEAWKGTCELQHFADRIHFAALHVYLNNLSMLQPNTSGAPESELQAFYEPVQTGQVGGYPVYDNHALVLTAGGVPPFADITVGEYLDDWRARLERRRAQALEAEARVAQTEKELDANIAEMEKTNPRAAAALRKGRQPLGKKRGVSELDRATAELNELERLRSSLTTQQRAQAVYLNARALEHSPFGYSTTPENGGRKLVRINPGLWQGVRSDSEVRTVVLDLFVNDKPMADKAQVGLWLEQADVSKYRTLLDK